MSIQTCLTSQQMTDKIYDLKSEENDIDEFMSFVQMTDQELDEIIQLSMND